jgi:peroxiredoxin
LRDDRERFQQAGANVVLIGLGRPDQAEHFCARQGSPFVCVVSSDRAAHRAFGLRRGTVNQTLGPRVWLPWLKNMATGNVQTGIWGQGDPAQLAGTFVVDTGGIVRYEHRARNVSDLAPNQEVLSAIAEIGVGKGAG